jgi:hypothetical protein
MAHHTELSKKCNKCQEAKPYPGDYIMSYLRQTMTTECKSCRTKRHKDDRVKSNGPRQSRNEWKNSMGKFYRSNMENISKNKD